MRLGYFLSALLSFFFPFVVHSHPLDLEGTSNKNSAARVIVYPKLFQVDDSTYPIKVLDAALTKAGIHHLLVSSETPMLQDRALRSIATNDGIDVFWSLTTVQREQQLRAVRFPIDKGLYGWRVLLVHPDKLKKSLNPADLRNWQYTQGHDWPNFDILQRNTLSVISANNFHSMVDLVQSGRVDAFPRSVLEVWQEIEQHQIKLQVHPDVVLHYPTALYFFFSKENEHLAQQVEHGLELLLASGEFDQMFFGHFGSFLQQAGLEHRQIIELQNPFLPLTTPLHRPELWYKPNLNSP